MKYTMFSVHLLSFVKCIHHYNSNYDQDIEQGFSIVSLYQNHLKRLLKYRMMASTFRVAD